MHQDFLDTPGWQEVNAIRRRGETEHSVTESIAEEIPVAIVVNGISHAVMMATPCDLEEFGIGFALSEGVVLRYQDIYDVELLIHGRSAEVHLTIAQEDFANLKRNRRAMSGNTGCGICGTESLRLLDLDPEPLPNASRASAILPTALCRAGQSLPSYQQLMVLTGGVHAAAWCDVNGNVIRAFEDVGRHNAMDKLIGFLAKDSRSVDNGFVFLSSRASFELVRKAARVGIAMVATISAPTSLAIDIAQRAGIRLVSFCRGDRFVDYSRPAIIEA